MKSTKQTMAQFRTENPKPALFNLLHKWNLPESDQQCLAYYKLAKLSAQKLAALLDSGLGTIAMAVPESEEKSDRRSQSVHTSPRATSESTIYRPQLSPLTNFVPMYQNISRATIKDDATKHHAPAYWLSFRLTRSGEAVVLIQKDTGV